MHLFTFNEYRARISLFPDYWEVQSSSSQTCNYLRLDLVAALVSLKIYALLQRELEYEKITEWFWTDSKIVLGYTVNNDHPFHVFVTNRVQQTKEHTDHSNISVQGKILLILHHKVLRLVNCGQVCVVSWS